MLEYKFDTQLLIAGEDLSVEYCASKGDIHDIVVENMERQENGLKG